MAKVQLSRLKISPYDNVQKIVELAGLDYGGYEDPLKPTSPGKVFYNGKYLFVVGVYQADLDSAYAEYNSDLENNLLKGARKEVADATSQSCFSFIESTYPIFKQQFFQALFTEAVALGLTNRILYIRGLLDWCKSIVEYANSVEGELENITDIVEIRSFEPDFSSFKESDPEVTINGALAIED